AQLLGQFMNGKMSVEQFYKIFDKHYSNGFDPTKHLERVGVVNQTTMLASDTQEIADYFRDVMLKNHGKGHIKDRFADTRDTLCYATNDNQQATFGLLKETADLAIVVGGFNSSNTSHLVELCEEKFPTYFISTNEEILSDSEIRHFDYQNKKMLMTKNYIPSKLPIRIILTSGASCPDAVVDGVMDRLLSFFPEHKNKETILKEFS
ncbi:MAG: 4-hydroxy-3-methylbut-2-enyl diphosphate reductase, partial [Flavobacteriales bacterium]|nr:4-hydroxy-3-methylbut-2-enyl diphosphate reductase [Flavobacteriales bacterium]